MRYANLLCVLMAALSTTSRTYAQQAVNIKDSLALVDFYNACNGPNWYFNHWFLETPVATWHGVTVTGDRVTAVEFIDNLITGPIPESFGNLTSLQSLSVRYNGIISLPESIGKLTNLHTLDLNDNVVASIPVPVKGVVLWSAAHTGYQLDAFLY